MLKHKLMIALAALLLAFTVACGPPPAPESSQSDETHSAEEGEESHNDDMAEDDMSDEEMADEEMAEGERTWESNSYPFLIRDHQLLL